jgi:hypothetical protein
MTRSTVLAAAALAAAAAAASPATAATLKKVPPALNPAKAYVVVEYKLLANPFGKFPGSRKTMPLTGGLAFGRYDPALRDIRGLGKAAANPLPAGQLAIEGFRNKSIAKGAATRLFLIEVDPGTWVVQGFGNTSFSLGSYTLELAPGTVTDLGVVSAEPDWAEGQRQANVGDVFKMALAGPFARSPDVAPMRATFRPREASDIALPAGWVANTARPVSFGEGATFGNYLGGLVNRIEGVNASRKAEAKTPN